ncbi:hypothetical protein ACOSP7_032427 [Xanthoceras sorbifolium]
MEVIGTNTFVFTFNGLTDRRRMLGGGPWCFDNALLVLEEPSGAGLLANMRFAKVMFWVQIHNVPLLCINVETCLFLGGLIGGMVEVDSGPTGECFGKYIRVRVWVDVTKPLKRFLRVAVGNDEPKTVMLLKYERLSDFCTQCGLLGHVARDYLSAPVGEQASQTNMKYGMWLRATSPVRNRPRKTNSGGLSSLRSSDLPNNRGTRSSKTPKE